MPETMTVTRVVFRFADGEVFALFPDDFTDHIGNVGCYQHVGGHCSADYAGCIAMSRPATETEYAPLAKELERIGYTLRIALRK